MRRRSVPLAKRADIDLCSIMRKNLPWQQRAWEILFARYHRLIHRLCKSYMLPGVIYDDLFQEACLGFRYSCLSYNGSTLLSTHCGWGVMKYCRQFTRQTKVGSVTKFISQGDGTETRYLETVAPEKRKLPRLSARGYNRMLMRIEKATRRFQSAKLTPEDRLAVAVAYAVGSKETRRAYRKHLWQFWLDRTIKDIQQRYLDCQKATKLRKRKR